jgi:hydrogenase maturation protease
LNPESPNTACNDPRGQADPKEASDAWDDSLADTVVLGIGNVLWADEGFGVRCVEALGERYSFGADVALVDGGTQGLHLLSVVQSARRLLILDAVDYGCAPGTLLRVEGEEVPRFMKSHKMSLHQTGFQEVLMLSLLCERYPQSVLLVGCQPEWLDDYGGSLRPCVRAAVEPALQMALAQLRDWGHVPVPRAEQAPPDSPLALQRYEAERPDAQTACRVGDARFMPAD